MTVLHYCVPPLNGWEGIQLWSIHLSNCLFVCTMSPAQKRCFQSWLYMIPLYGFLWNPDVGCCTHWSAWPDEWLPKLNIDKCKSVSYCIKQSIDTKYHIMDRNQLYPLEKVKSMVDLGVRLDTNWTFGDHISEKINNAYTVLGIIKRSFICMDEHTLYCFIKQWYVHMLNLPILFGVHSNLVLLTRLRKSKRGP